jgi:hypothetical protein
MRFDSPSEGSRSKSLPHKNKVHAEVERREIVSSDMTGSMKESVFHYEDAFEEFYYHLVALENFEKKKKKCKCLLIQTSKK